MAPRTNAIWNYFEKLNAEKAKCNICECDYSIKGRTNTSLINHLNARHKDVFKNYKQIQAKKKEEEIANTSEPLPMKQPTLNNCLTPKWSADYEKSVEVDKAVAELIALEDMPFQLVDKPAFIRLLKVLQPRYNLRGRTYFTEFICEKMFSKISTQVKSVLEKLRYISLTSDAWSEPSAGVSLISLTCHGINDNFERVYIPLKCAELPGSHAGAAIAAEIETLLKNWNIPKSKVHCLLRDGAANMKSAATLMGMEHFVCVAHSLQLCINAVLKFRDMESILTKFKSIATHFAHSTLAQSRLKAIQTQINQPFLSPKQSCLTRWNSTFYMMERFIEIKDSISLYGNKFNISQISAAEWRQTEALVKVLGPFEQITRWLSASDACISSIIPYISILKGSLEGISDEAEDDFMKCIILELLSEVKLKFEDLHMNSLLTCATFLDPRFKVKFFDSATTELVISILLQSFSEVIVETTSSSKETQVQKDNANLSAFEAAFLNCLNDNHEEESEEQSTEEDASIRSLINKYVKIKRIDPKSNPLKWWLENKEFSVLYDVVFKYLSPPPTSVDSERLFSGAGLIYTDLRNRLSADNASKLLFIKNALPKINYKY